jgi:hypothetical protein
VQAADRLCRHGEGNRLAALSNGDYARLATEVADDDTLLMRVFAVGDLAIEREAFSFRHGGLLPAKRRAASHLILCLDV